LQLEPARSDVKIGLAHEPGNRLYDTMYTVQYNIQLQLHSFLCSSCLVLFHHLWGSHWYESNINYYTFQSEHACMLLRFNSTSLCTE